jgi:hypothetical protein
VPGGNRQTVLAFSGKSDTPDRFGECELGANAGNGRETHGARVNYFSLLPRKFLALLHKSAVLCKRSEAPLRTFKKDL